MSPDVIVAALPPPPENTKTSVMPYLIALLGFGALTMASIVLITAFRPSMDNTSLIIQIVGFAGTMLTATLAFLKSQETHAVVNSRMDEFKATLAAAALAAQTAARAEGVAQGRADGRQAADARTDDLKAHKS